MREKNVGIFFRYDKTFGALLFNFLNYAFLLLLGFVTLYPFMYVLALSLSDYEAVADKVVRLFPIGFNLSSYDAVLKSDLITRSYLNTVYYSISGVLVALFLLVITAYPLSIREFFGRQFFTVMFAVTMFFSGGLIPTYLVVRSLGMLNTIWALIIPSAIGVFYLIIIRTNFQRIPESLRESAHMDGANHLRILFSIYLPLSVPILSTMFLFIIVSRWNSFFAPLIYMNDMKKQPLQVILRDILSRHMIYQAMDEEATDLAMLHPGAILSLRAATIIISTGPILLVYPFIQRYFVKGVLIGSIKG